MRSAGLYFDKRQHILIPSNKIDFSSPPGRTVIPGNHHVTPPAKIKVGSLFPEPADTLTGRKRVPWTLIRMYSIQYVDGRLDQSGKHGKSSTILGS